MRITRLQLTDFKRHASLEIKPAPGLTIIRGPNEAGKSSIAQAIELVLFRKADANREDVRQAWAWGAADPPQVMLDLRDRRPARAPGQAVRRLPRHRRAHPRWQEQRRSRLHPGAGRGHHRYPQRGLLPLHRLRRPQRARRGQRRRAGAAGPPAASGQRCRSWYGQGQEEARGGRSPLPHRRSEEPRPAEGGARGDRSARE